jgi:single-strand DNA-binding protein
MATLNRVMLIGRLTRDPEPPRSLPNGGTVVKFGFAVGRSKKNPQTGQWENDPNPLFIDCEVFSRPDSKRNLPELITQFTKKGDSLYIEGRLQLDQWEDKNGGGKRSKHKLVVDSIEFLGGKNSEGGGSAGEGEGGGGRQYGGGNSGGSRQTGGGRTAPPPPPSHDDEYGGNDGGGNSGGGSGDPIPF